MIQLALLGKLVPSIVIDCSIPIKLFVMALQENSSEINSSPAHIKKFSQSTIASLRNLLVFSKTLPFIGGLIVSYKFVEAAVVFILMDYLTVSWGEDNRQIAIVVTNVQDGLSSIFFIFVSQISEEYTGCFAMITYCVPVSIVGLVLLWTSTSPSAFGAIYAAIVLLVLGKGGEKLSENFLEYQLQDHVGTICIKICSFVPSFVVYIMTVYIAFERDGTYKSRFRFAAFLMLGTYALFLVGYLWYSREELPVESNLRKIYRTCKAALGKWKSKYPTSPNFYYWKDYKQGHLYEHGKGKGLRLLPRVPRLFRWLDKAAIVKSRDPEVIPGTQEKKGKLCTVKEVREVKSLVPMIYLGFTFFGYSFLLASGNTFFVSQASSAVSVITNIDGNDIFILFLIKDVMNKMSRFICFLILRCLTKFGIIDFMPKRKEATIIRVGFGMFCAVICCLIAWRVEVLRLSQDTNTTVTLVPQFILLGMAEGLVEGGFTNLFYGYVAESMWSFADSFSELVIGTGKLLITPLVLIFRSWFNGYYDTSHLDRYFLMLGILNSAFLLVFAYYSFRYAYKEVCPVDAKVTMEQRLEHAHQPDSQDSNQENNNEALDQVITRINEERAEDEDENEIVSIRMIKGEGKLEV
ncbi:NRT1/ PTR FAMILY 5.6 [Spatholobus suberectus]|nr:NRT1/ PTR FAMILY 5.6 [Spatholobus suberectus]